MGKNKKVQIALLLKTHLDKSQRDTYWLTAQRGKKVWHHTHNQTWNVRSMNQGRLEIVKQEMEYLNIAVLGVSELKWTWMEDLHSGNYKMFYNGHDKLRRNKVSLIRRQDVTQAVRGYNKRSDWVPIRLLGKSIT